MLESDWLDSDIGPLPQKAWIAESSEMFSFCEVMLPRVSGEDSIAPEYSKTDNGSFPKYYLPLLACSFSCAWLLCQPGA